MERKQRAIQDDGMCLNRRRELAYRWIDYESFSEGETFYWNLVSFTYPALAQGSFVALNEALIELIFRGKTFPT